MPGEANNDVKQVFIKFIKQGGLISVYISKKKELCEICILYPTPAKVRTGDGSLVNEYPLSYPNIPHKACFRK